MKFVVALLLAVLAIAVAFHAPASTRAPRMSMMFNFGKKAAQPAQTDYKVGQGTANKGTYVPDGLTKEQYDQFLKAESEKKNSNTKKFFKGKVTESLTEWMKKNEDKGLEGQELNRKGHRMLKCKYDGWYTDESPV